MGFLNKIVYWINIIAAFLLLISFVLPYVPPKSFPTLSLLSLIVSPLILMNILFFVYYAIRLKRKLIISLIVLMIAYLHFNPFFEFSSENNSADYNNTLHILSYNVRLFNAYEKNPSKDVSIIISEILNIQQPDVICIQEYYNDNKMDFSGYPYSFIHFNDGKGIFGHAIFSKYPLLNKGAFDFKDSNNNTIYVDIVKGDDTLRIYNLHLQSLGITPGVISWQEGKKDKLIKRISRTFIIQQQQMEDILDHKNTSPNPVLLCGDFNNTRFSYVYRRLRGDMKDAFVECGNGIGTTYLFDSYPMRIDFILVSKELDVVKFETVKKSFSDHYPVSATVGWD